MPLAADATLHPTDEGGAASTALGQVYLRAIIMPASAW